jgi:hypothetical protein
MKRGRQKELLVKPWLELLDEENQLISKVSCRFSLKYSFCIAPANEIHSSPPRLLAGSVNSHILSKTERTRDARDILPGPQALMPSNSLHVSS